MLTKFRKNLLLAFLLAHIVTISFRGFWTTYDVYVNVHYQEQSDIPYLHWTRQSSPFLLYYNFIGTDTGYGFYGIKVATEKYFKVTYYNNQRDIIFSDRFHGLITSNGRSRFKSYASRMANYMDETSKLETKMDPAYNDLIHFRKDYVKKSFKWVARNYAVSVPDCAYYTVELITIVPRNIWKAADFREMPNIYMIQQYTFNV